MRLNTVHEDLHHVRTSPTRHPTRSGCRVWPPEIGPTASRHDASYAAGGGVASDWNRSIPAGTATAPPGSPPADTSSVVVTTRGPIADGADTVVQVEDTEQIPAGADGSKRVKILVRAAVGQDIRIVGCNIEKDSIVLKSGELIGPAEIGLLAIVAVTTVKVYPRLIWHSPLLEKEHSGCYALLRDDKLGVDTVPVLIGPVSYLLLLKPSKGVEKGFPLLSPLSGILPVYKEVIAELKAAGASWIQIDDPTLVLDLDSQKLAAFSAAYTELESALSGLRDFAGQ